MSTNFTVFDLATPNDHECLNCGEPATKVHVGYDANNDQPMDATYTYCDIDSEMSVAWDLDYASTPAERAALRGAIDIGE